MQLEDQVVTLEQAKKIHELWFNKESCFVYTPRDEYELWIHIVYSKDTRISYWKAYTVSELMEYLPAYISPFHLFIKKHTDNTYKVWYIRWYSEDENDRSYESSYIIYNTNLTQALWDMLIYLLENKLINNE